MYIKDYTSKTNYATVLSLLLGISAWLALAVGLGLWEFHEFHNPAPWVFPMAGAGLAILALITGLIGSNLSFRRPENRGAVMAILSIILANAYLLVLLVGTVALTFYPNQPNLGWLFPQSHPRSEYNVYSRHQGIQVNPEVEADQNGESLLPASSPDQLMEMQEEVAQFATRVCQETHARVREKGRKFTCAIIPEQWYSVEGFTVTIEQMEPGACRITVLAQGSEEPTIKTWSY